MTRKRIFLSAGEPSGDLHGANLIAALKAQHPDIEIVGFGGQRMEAAGAKLLYPLCNHAIMWFLKVIGQIRTFARLVGQAKEYFHTEKPDALVVIDYPGFHFALAKRAKAAGIPVIWFVPPQLWAWAGWRVKKMRNWVSHVLCSLPFEYDWYSKYGVNATFNGHPYFDELPAQQLDGEFVTQQRQRSGTVVAVLPGSRTQEVKNNLPMMLQAAVAIHAQRPETRFMVASFNAEQAELARAMVALHPGLPIEIHVGRTPEIIEVATTCLSVSGSVSLELMYRLKPTVIVYRMGGFAIWLGHQFMQTRFITLVNLLADDMLFPEFLTSKDESKAMASRIVRWLEVPSEREAVQAKLYKLREAFAQTGACERAASYILNVIEDAKSPSADRHAA